MDGLRIAIITVLLVLALALAAQAGPLRTLVVAPDGDVTGMPKNGIRSVTNQHVTIRGNTLDGNGRWT